LLEPGQQTIFSAQLIDAPAAFRTFAEVGGNLAQLRFRKLAQGQRTQRFVTRMV
jgi:hypothetical protein